MDGLTYKGWTLDIQIDSAEDNVRHMYYAHCPGRKSRILHVSSYLTCFQMAAERFHWLVDNDFPRPAKGNWFTHEIDEAINADCNSH